jgi:hypothetical protein
MDRTLSVLNLTEWLRVTEAGIRLSADIDCNEQQQQDLDKKKTCSIYDSTNS